MSALTKFVMPIAAVLAGPLLQHLFYNRQRGEYVRPTRVEGQLRHHFGGLRLREAVVHCPVQVIRQLRELPRGYKRTDRHQASISWREARTQPEIMKKCFRRVVHDTWRHRTEVLLNGCCPLSFRGLVDWKLFARNRRQPG
jgi:hypothetical protein